MMIKNSLKKDGLNVIPLIDVMLVLLCIVLSISTFIAQGKIKVEIPKTQSGVKENEPNSINITVNAESAIFFNDEMILPENLEAKLKNIDSKTLIILKSDKNAKFESFIKIIDILKVKKHENFAIATEVTD